MIIEHKDCYWRYWDCGDGSFAAREVHHPRGKDMGNTEYFPTLEEACLYAKCRTSGFLHIGALMKLMEHRIARARADHASLTTETKEVANAED
ncbi:hypothetical protein PXH69_24720 [Rhodococcus qingshengii]|uniref:Uncharacterized protein n=1 Tax=Rhodococcus qingshengii TaxID=334542 RepID=A0AAW6LS18_RHOSG|nr:hypothetical protein [Rhodococcus qingshengii]MDE8648175.1 hypothetical protein [Rhodococcus qingshengii]